MKKVLLLAPLFLQFGNANSQQATTSAGGNASGSGGTVSYSIGQVGYSTTSGSYVTLTAGVQQPYTIQTVGLPDVDHPFTLQVYPNPTSSDLTVVLLDAQSGPYRCQLLDALGKVVSECPVEGKQTRLATGHLPASMYFLQVLRDHRVVQSFRIVKN